MKKTAVFSTYILIALIIALPICVILSDCIGYDFELANYPVSAVITALWAVFTVILSLSAKAYMDSRILPVLYAAAAPLSFINTLFYMLADFNLWVVGSMCICCLCCFFLTLLLAKPLGLKVTSLVLWGLMILPMGFFTFACALTGEAKVIQSLSSPNGTYNAQIIDDDQGALGGSTLVWVYEDKSFDALIFKVSKSHKIIYSGRWEEFKNMELHWKNEHCLVINSTEYAIE